MTSFAPFSLRKQNRRQILYFSHLFPFDISLHSIVFFITGDGGSYFLDYHTCQPSTVLIKRSTFFKYLLRVRWLFYLLFEEGSFEEWFWRGNSNGSREETVYTFKGQNYLWNLKTVEVHGGHKYSIAFYCLKSKPSFNLCIYKDRFN